MSRVIYGTVRGKTIELNEDPGVPDGEQVQVVVTSLPVAENWGEGIRRSAGGWADVPEMDEIMEQIQQDRKRERRAVG